MATALVLSQPRLVGTPTPLLFGAEFVPPAVTVDAAFSLGGIEVSAFIDQPVEVNAVFGLGGIEVSAVCFYDNRVTPWLDCRAAAPHQPALLARPDNASQWQTSVTKREGTRLPYTGADARAMEPVAGFGVSIPKRNQPRELWELAIQQARDSSSSYQKAMVTLNDRLGRWQLGDYRRAESTSAMQAGIFHARHRDGKWQTARPWVKDFAGPIGASTHYAGVQASHMPWQLAGGARAGKSILILPPIVPPVFSVNGDLLFQCPPLLFPALVFGAFPCYLPSALFYILPARFYMTSHTIYAERLADSADIPIYEATVSADMGSYCWTLQASGPASLFTLLAPVAGLPTQLRVWLDGIPFVFAVDALQRSQKFGQTGVTISGRSVTALIGSPFMRATTRDNASGALTAQQLAAAALDTTGIALDWGVGSGALANGGLIDWLVSAGAWSHQGTPLDAVQAIAQAAGGYLQSHRSAATLLTRHPYGQRLGDAPGAPWGWMTGAADVELALDALITDGTERKDGPDINAVYVSGTTQGVLSLVRRAGSAADKLAVMVTDPLMTATEASRQRGLAILGAAGNKYNVVLELPVLTGTGQPGVIDVGQLVQVNAATPWRGRVRAVSVAAKRPSLRQTVTLERHLETV